MRITIWTLGLTVGFCSSPTAQAQDLSRVEVAGAYQNVALRHEFDWADYHGWGIEEATFIRPQLAVPVVVDAVYWNWVAPNTSTVGQHNRRYGFLAGVRATGSRDRPLIPFVQMLAGVARVSHVLYFPGIPDYASATSVFAVQPGAGVDFRVRPTAWIRASFDARVGQPRYAISWQYPEWRFQVGLVYRFAK